MKIGRSGPSPRWRLPGVLVLGLAATACRGGTRVSLDDLPLLGLEPGHAMGRFVPTLGPVRWVGRGPDGRVVLGQTEDHEIRIFDSTGAEAASVGGPGQWTRRGSSEDPLQGGAGWIGDTLWVRDASLGRIILYHPVGERVRTLPPLPGARPGASAEGTPTFLSVWPLVLFPGDTLLVLANQAVGGGEIGTDGMHLLRIRSDGLIVRDLGRVPAEPEARVRPLPMGAAHPSSFHVAPGGDRIGLLDVGGGQRGGAWRILVLTGQGDTLLDRRYRLGGDARPTAIALGSDARIWVTVSSGPGEVWWLVIGPDGAPEGRLDAPGMARILRADATHLWISKPAPDGTLEVVRARIRPEDPSASES